MLWLRAESTNKSNSHILAKTTLLATGGIGTVYATTTNPGIATGDGIAMAQRARAVIADMEFVQFHPTGLYQPGARPTHLITEAILRLWRHIALQGWTGIYAKVRWTSRLLHVTLWRAIDNEMKIRGHEFVYLDVTHKDAEETKKHFPNIYKNV